MFIKLSPYLRLMRFDKPIGILLLLWPTLWALWLAAHGFPSLPILLIFIGGVVLMRAAGCVINDYADRHLDGKVQRTQSRPLATGQVSVKGALCLFVFLCLFAFGLVLLLNTLTILLAVVGFLLAAIYPFSKRFLPVPQVVLGLSFALGILMAFAAETGHLPLQAWVLFIATFCWIVAYDTQYAMVDREDDKKIGIKSSAIYFGRFDRLWIGALQLVMLLLLILTGWLLSLHQIYYVLIITAVGFFIFQQCLIYRQDREKCFQAFLNNNWVGAVIFLGIVINFSQH